MKKILITGASGFLGAHLSERLREEGHELVLLNSKNCDLTLQDSLLHFNEKSYDEIFHLAAWTQAGDFCLFHPGEQWIINQKINTNVLGYWQKHQPQAKLICMGTSCSYDPEMELIENNYMLGTPINSLFTYAMTKRMLYAGLKALNKQYGLRYLYLVPSTLYGPGYHTTDERQMHFIFDIIRKIVRGRRYNDPVVLWGDGDQKRELVFVDDFVTIMLKLNNLVDNELINVGAGKDYSIRYFADLVCREVGYNSDKIIYDTSRYIGAKSKCLVISKLLKLAPNMKSVKLEEGLRITIDWFCSHFYPVGNKTEG